MRRCCVSALDVQEVLIDGGVQVFDLGISDDLVVSSNNGTGWGFQQDPIEYVIARCWLPIPSLSRDEFYGITSWGTDISSPRTPSKIKDFTPAGKYDGWLDYRRYSNGLSNLLQRGLSPIPHDAGWSEKPVKNVVLEGSVRPKGLGLYETPIVRVGNCYGLSFPVPAEALTLGGTQLTHRSVSGGTCGYVQTSSPYRGTSVGWGSLLDALSWLSSNYEAAPVGSIYTNPEGFSGWGTSGYRTRAAAVKFGSFGYKLRSRGFSFWYRRLRSNTSGSLSIDYDRHVDVTFTLANGAPYIDSSLGGPKGGGLRASAQIVYTSSDIRYRSWPNAFYSVPYVNSTVGQGARKSTSVVKVIPVHDFRCVSYAYGSSPRLQIEIISKRHERLTGWVNEHAQQLRAGAAISASDAAENLKSSSNWVETLSEASSVIGLATGPLSVVQRLSDVLLGQKVYRKWGIKDRWMTKGERARIPLRRKYAGGTVDLVILLADMIAELILLQSFGLSPTVGDAKELGNLEDLLRKTAIKLSVGFIARGKHKAVVAFPLTDFGLQGDLDVTIRTKAFARPVSERFVVEALKLESLGLLPTPSRVWDTRPFSFILDYFLKIGDRMEVFQNHLFWCWMGTRFVNSYRLASTLVELDFDDGFEWAGAASFVFYAREVSNFAPSASSREDSLNLLPPRGPSSTTGLALIWVLLRSAASILSK